MQHEQANFSLSYPQFLGARKFDENGSKGKIYLRFSASGATSQKIAIWVEIKEKMNPTLQDVAVWHREDISFLTKPAYEYVPISFEETTIKGFDVIRHKYAFEQSDLTYDAIYIARKNDMVVIRMRVSSENYELYRQDFEELVISFKPFE